jgi:hypothetical protein
MTRLWPAKYSNKLREFKYNNIIGPFQEDVVAHFLNVEAELVDLRDVLADV